jgi:urate oxidase
MIMTIKLANNAYGKNAVNLSKIIRHRDYHEFRQISVNVSLEGDFVTVHTIGDNSKVLPTDTQKNTVYALAKEHFAGSIEEFGIYLANHFFSNNAQLSQCIIEISEHLWNRMLVDGRPHPHAYISGGFEKHITSILQSREKIQITSGIKDLLILKTTDSGFENYIMDKYTTLKETSDRIFATNCEVSWLYEKPPTDFTSAFHEIRETLINSFASHKSLSVQHTLYAMAEKVLEKFSIIKEISLKMPNKHHIPFNLQQFDMENNNEIFIATDEPYGYITGTITRE